MIDTSYLCPRCKCEHNLPDESLDGHRTTCLYCDFPFVVRVRREITIDAECVEHTWGEWINGWNSEISFCKLCGASQTRNKEPTI